ncbi:MAG: hypothetical protein KKC76_12405 [Proteobacteria bacterium]|nr:hypothetical protein [Pseudomonadota bacterium]MBU4295342.1 hypothetical protein [Pseudomonadota bacterium]MCG2748198.1 hypothetical protein [Desulfobulbaceae bacterium]
MTTYFPNFKNRSAHSIVTENIRNESSGYIYRALSWIDLAKREKSSPCFQYAAHDTRQGIEQLLFEELILSTGAALDRSEYLTCLGNSTKLHAIIKRLSPDREKLATFVKTLMSVVSPQLNIVVWDHNLLMRYWGRASNYLHWSGAIDETVDKWQWVVERIACIEEICMYIWVNQTENNTGTMHPCDMHPAVAALWERFKAGKIGVEEVKLSARLLADS